MSTAHAPSGESLDVGGEIVVQSLEGQVAVPGSARTQNLHTGDLLYLPPGEHHFVKGVEDASLFLSRQLPHKDSEAEVSSAQDPELNLSPQNERIYARGVLLSVMQTVVLVAALALLFIAVAGNIFAGVLIVGPVLVLFGCLHYWLWGRWMSSALFHPSRKQRH